MLYLDNRIQRELLEDYDIRTEPIVINKNGVDMPALRILGGDAGDAALPVIYISGEDTAADVIRQVTQVTGGPRPTFELEQLTDWEYAKPRIFLSIQKRSDEAILKKDLLNLELCLRVYVRIGRTQGSVLVDSRLQQTLGVSEDELWQTAYANTEGLYEIHPLRSLFEVMGIPYEVFGDDEPDDLSGSEGVREEAHRGNDMYVVTTDRLVDAASALAYPAIPDRFCLEHGEPECILLPSSTKELILLPGSAVADIDPMLLAQMVAEINQTVVEAPLRLDPCVYRYSRATQKIEIIAQV